MAAAGRKQNGAATNQSVQLSATNQERSGLLDEHKSSDPLLKQLPAELTEFIKFPDASQVAFVERSSQYECIHKTISMLCYPCWSCCRTHIVKQGQIALTQYGETPEILGPGKHVLLSPANEWIGVKSITDAVIKHGPIHIIKVRRGELGYGIDMKMGVPVLLAQGTHVIKSAEFVWKRHVNFRDQITQLDAMEIIRVEMGNVGYAYRGGNLVILKPGLHLIQPPDRFGSIVSTQMSILDLPPSVFDTSDYVPLSVKASVFFRIADPKKALLRIRNITKQLSDTCLATLAGIIRSSSLSDVASRSQPFYNDPSRAIESKDDSEDDDGAVMSGLTASSKGKKMGASAVSVGQTQVVPSAPPFFQHVHDEFIQLLADHVIEDWGIEIQNIRIESLKINDSKLQKDISAQAVTVSKQHNKFIMLQKAHEITRVEANQHAEEKLIRVQADARAVRERAQADADAVIIRAKAEKAATELRGQGEEAYSKSVASTELGRDLSLMRVQSEALSGLKSIAYVPHLPGLLNKKGVFRADLRDAMPEFAE